MFREQSTASDAHGDLRIDTICWRGIRTKEQLKRSMIYRVATEPFLRLDNLLLDLRPLLVDGGCLLQGRRQY